MIAISTLTAAEQRPTQAEQRSTRVPTRTKQLRDIHQAAHAAGFVTALGKPGRELYENELMMVCGRRSMRQATRAERVEVLSHFEALAVLA